MAKNGYYLVMMNKYISKDGNLVVINQGTQLQYNAKDIEW